MLKRGLAYAKKGWAVFPLHSQVNGVCTCRNQECRNPAKHPRVEGGLKAATTDPDTITGWWTTWPNANIGVATGAVSGIVVVDTDLKNDGPSNWSDLQDIHGPIETLTVLTGSGGNHWVFLNPLDRTLKNTAGKLGPGIDTRGEGGYIVAPPSLHISGDRYEWDHKAAIAPVPDWVLDLWTGSTNGVPTSERDQWAEPIGDEIPEGERNHTLMSLAGSMRRRGMSEEAILAALMVENRTRCKPPLPEDEVQAIAASVAQYPAGVPAIPRQQDPLTDIAPPRKQQWPSPVDRAAYHGLTGELVDAIAPHTEADPVSILLTHLVYFGNAAGRGYHAKADAARHGTNLNVVIVGETSNSRKGSSREQIHRVYQEVDPDWADACIKGGMSSGEGLIWNVRDPIEKTEAIKENNKFTGGYQTHIIDQGLVDKRLLAYEPEYAQVLRVMSRETNTLSTQVRQAWDTGMLRTMTKNTPAQATGAHISILGHITKDELLRELNEIEAANGFANRFLWACANRAQYLPEGGGEAATGHLIKPLQAALEHAKTDRLIARDPQAKIAWNDIYRALSSGKPGLFGAITARAEAQVLRLSVLYAAMDRASEIQLPHLEAAMAVWEYCEASAAYIFGDATGDPVADRILEGLRIGPLNRTEISYLFKRNVNATRITQALALLAQAGLARQHMEQSDGRPIEVWAAINRG
ncbi:MAG: bifunctional DNA primase/polymerase [Chloroflexi bacterium]|nr:bifunctional DNA primase/polymerase [Chloroflexota bacterium]